MCRHKVLVGHLGLGVEQAVGAYTTVLSADINASTTSITVNRCITVSKLWNKLYSNRNRRNILHRYINKHTLTGVTRGVRNTTAASHTAGATVTNTSDYVAWGEAASGDLIIDPGMWSLITLVTKLFV